MKIYDLFLFNGEIDMLFFRLKELSPRVTQFILVEATHTFKGDKKVLYYERYKDKFKDYPIHYIKADCSVIPHYTAWEREGFIRNYAKKYLLDTCTNEDLIMLSDLDEIPDFRRFQTTHLIPYCVYMDFYYYNFNCVNEVLWPGTVCFSRRILERPSLNEIREKRCHLPKVYGGWHMSYFMTSEEISRKLSSFSHQEYNNSEYNDIRIIENRIENREDLFNREGERWIKDKESLEGTILPVYHNSLPYYMQRDFEE